MSGSGDESWESQDDGKDEDAHDTHKIISKKAMKDFHRAKQRFLTFLMEADVWSQEQVRHAPSAWRPAALCMRRQEICDCFAEPASAVQAYRELAQTLIPLMQGRDTTVLLCSRSLDAPGLVGKCTRSWHFKRSSSRSSSAVACSLARFAGNAEPLSTPALTLSLVLVSPGACAALTS